MLTRRSRSHEPTEAIVAARPNADIPSSIRMLAVAISKIFHAYGCSPNVRDGSFSTEMGCWRDVCFSPDSDRTADITGGPVRAMCGRLRVGKDFLHVLQDWSVRPCVRPVSAVHMTAGHNALRGSGPDQQPAFDNAWGSWVILIAGSTGSALRAVRPPNLHITPGVRRDLVYAASSTGSLYRSPLVIMAQTIRAILLASTMAATLVGRRASNAVSQGRCLAPWILA